MKTKAFLFFALIICISFQATFTFQILKLTKLNQKLYPRLFSEKGAADNEKPRAETLGDAYISPPSIEPSVIDTNNRESSSKIKSGVKEPISFNELQISSIVGSTLFGLILGGVSDLTISSDLDPSIAPLVAALSLGGGTAFLEQSDFEQPKNIVSTLFGKPTLRVKNGIQNAIVRSIDNARDAIENKKNEIVNGIKAIPNNIKLAILSAINRAQKKATDKITEVVDEILAAPRAVADGVKNSIDEKVNAVKTSVQNQVDSVLEGPRKLQESISNSVNSVTQTFQPEQSSESTDEALQAIKQVIEAEKSKAKKAQAVTSAPVEDKTSSEPALKFPNFGINFPSEEKQSPVQEAVKPTKAATVAKLSAAKSTSIPTNSEASPFQFFEQFNTFSKGSSVDATSPAAAKKASEVKHVSKVASVEKAVPKAPLPKLTASAQTSSSKSSSGLFSFFSSASDEPTTDNKKASVATTRIASATLPKPAALPKPALSVTGASSTFENSSGSNGLFSFFSKSAAPEKPAAEKKAPAITTKKSTSLPVSVPSKVASDTVKRPPFSTGSTISTKPFVPSSDAKKAETPQQSVAAVVPAKPQPSPVVPVPKATVTSKPVFSTGSVKTTPVEPKVTTPSNAENPSKSTEATAAPSILSPNAVKSLKAYGLGESSISTIDKNAEQFNSGKVNVRQLYAVLLSELRGKDLVYNALPDIIGSLPQGPQKFELNNFYQQIA